jgi:hypothetical protein
MRTISSGGSSSVWRWCSPASASARWVANAPYSSSVPGQLCQTAAASFRPPSAASSEISPSEWFRKCAAM